jgi:flavin reductase (DIM6/NTAB) family NADH-FMN oxidoreductase RutF
MTKIVEAAPRLTPAADGQAFRDAMARLASPTHIVTTAGQNGRAGLTATAVASVSDAPPTVLVCIEANSRTLAAIAANGVFCINTLPGGSTDLAETFAGRRGIEGEARFASARWGRLASGAPVLEQALAAFDCRLVAIREVATHRIVIGEVLALGGAGQGASLIYRNRRFETV